MALNEKLLNMMADGRFVSGEVLAEKLGVSRAAVWQQLQAWQNVGIRVDAVRGRGYRLTAPFEPLAAGQIVRRLARPDALHLHVKSRTTSTNEDCLALLNPGEKLQVVAAELQQAGRGRMGRQWLSLPGYSLVFSLGRCEHSRPADLAGLSLLAGLAVAECLRAHGLTNVGLKWPNDLVVNQGGSWQKLGGILVELKGAFADAISWVVGIGLNLGPSCPPVENGAYMSGHLSQWWQDAAMHRNALLADILDHWLACESEYKQTGLAGLHERWMRLDVLQNKFVSVHIGTRIHAGIARGISKEGLFLLDTEDGLKRFSGGEISVRPAPQARGDV